MAENELATLLGVDSRLAGDLIFASPDGSSARIKAAWDLVVGYAGDKDSAREWLVTPNVALADRPPVVLWLTDGFAAFESAVAATVYGPPGGP